MGFRNLRKLGFWGGSGGYRGVDPLGFLGFKGKRFSFVYRRGSLGFWGAGLDLLRF